MPECAARTAPVATVVTACNGRVRRAVSSTEGGTASGDSADCGTAGGGSDWLAACFFFLLHSHRRTRPSFITTPLASRRTQTTTSSSFTPELEVVVHVHRDELLCKMQCCGLLARRGCCSHCSRTCGREILAPLACVGPLTVAINAVPVPPEGSPRSRGHGLRDERAQGPFYEYKSARFAV